jgi:hypothetical protein
MLMGDRLRQLHPTAGLGSVDPTRTRSPFEFDHRGWDDTERTRSAIIDAAWPDQP